MQDESQRVIIEVSHRQAAIKAKGIVVFAPTATRVSGVLGVPTTQSARMAMAIGGLFV